MNFPVLSAIIFTPWLGALLLTLLRGAKHSIVRALALLFSLSTLAFAAVAWSRFDASGTQLQFVEDHEWIRSLNVSYHLGLDGLSLTLVLLTAIVSPLALLAGWGHSHHPRLFGALFLMLQGAALGVFLALDFFHWFVFWELSLIPAFFLIKVWGGTDSTRAAYQFVIYTIGGSAFMLLGFAAIYAATGTMDFAELAPLAANGVLAQKLSSVGGWWPHAIFLGVFLGLAVKVPLWPLHTWLPAAYAEAPTGVSMFLTGVMSKMGVYGFLRILLPLFPTQLHAAAPCLLWLALGGVVLGAYAAIRQTDLKRMIAYSSVNHLSYCLLAIFAVAAVATNSAPAAAAKTAALSGTLFQIFNHGISAAALFFCIGILEERAGRAGTPLPASRESRGIPPCGTPYPFGRGLNDFGGVRAAAPIFAGLSGIAMFSSLGLPGLNGFVGEFLIFRGVFGLVPWAAGVACLGLFATAWFLLTFWQRVYHGPRRGAASDEWHDVQAREYAVLIPLVVLMFVLGVLPQLLAGVFNPLVTAWGGMK